MASKQEQAVKNLDVENTNQENAKKDEKEQDANKGEPLALPLEAGEYCVPRGNHRQLHVGSPSCSTDRTPVRGSESHRQGWDKRIQKEWRRWEGWQKSWGESSSVIVYSHYHHSEFCLFFFFFFLDFTYLFLEKGEEREKEKERNINVWLPFICPSIGDLALNPGMCPDWESNQRPFSSQSVLNPLSPTSQVLA